MFKQGPFQQWSSGVGSRYRGGGGRRPGRLWVRNVKGSEGVDFRVAYEGTSSWTSGRSTGSVSSTKGSTWTLQNPMNLQPTNASGWQPMQLLLVGKGTTSEFQVYDLYIDPRMR